MKKYHIILNLLGTLFWISGLILSANLIYPYALIGIFGGPLLLLAGIIFWLRYYTQKNKRFPNPVSSYRRSVSKQKGIFRGQKASFDFVFTHALEIWTSCIIFWVGMSFLAGLMLKSSSAFKSVVVYAENDKELEERIGKINDYGFLVSGSTSSDGTGDLHFTIIGENESVKAHAIVENHNGQSTVTSLTYNY